MIWSTKKKRFDTFPLRLFAGIIWCRCEQNAFNFIFELQIICEPLFKAQFLFPLLVSPSSPTKLTGRAPYGLCTIFLKFLGVRKHAEICLRSVSLSCFHYLTRCYWNKTCYCNAFCHEIRKIVIYYWVTYRLLQTCIFHTVPCMKWRSHGLNRNAYR